MSDAYSARIVLLERQGVLSYLCDNGIEDADAYAIACEGIGFLRDYIEDHERTDRENKLLQCLLKLTNTYEEEHCLYGN